ncbi:MAG: peptide ABC transporter substrate-binding protein [Candidatus Doudnabacteria bacterium]|nr:peptide ABC transporter substrate-binding protein [Candidatus Doudnabacteria bacterium]
MRQAEKILDYAKLVVLGIKNLQFFHIGSLPKLFHRASLPEKRIFIGAVAMLVASVVYLIIGSFRQATVAVADFGGKYTEGLVGQPRFINPALAIANDVDLDISRVVFSGLYKFNAQQELVPDLAKSLPAISPDQKQYTIELRTDATWHDGQPFDADDVIFTTQLIQNPLYQSPLRFNWNRVEVNKLDEHKILVSLKEPSAPFVSNLTQGILPKHIWERVEPGNFVLSKFNLQPIGTGPFVVKHLKKSDEGAIVSLTLAAFEQYAPQRPYLNELEFKFFESYDDLISAYHSKDVTGLGYVPFDKKIYLEKSSRINLYYLSLPRYQALFLNRQASPVLADKNVRAALAQSLNRQEIINEVYLGFARPAYGPVPPGYLGYNSGVEQAHRFNLTNAKNLLAQSGFAPVEGSAVLKKGTVDLAFTVTTDNFPLNVKTAELLKKQWEKIGFQINLQILTLGELQQDRIANREYESLLFSENVGADPDPYPFWHSSQRTDPGLNLSSFASKEADALITEARTNADPAYRAARYLRFQELIVDDVPAIFIANSLFVYGVDTKIMGIALQNIVDQSQRFLNVEQWYLKTKRQLKK